MDKLIVIGCLLGLCYVQTIEHPPSRARLLATSTNVVKGSSVTLSCLVDNPGNPDALTYVWYRGSRWISKITTSNWTIDPVGFNTKKIFTCYASNAGGNSDSASIFINVSAPPTFLQDLKEQRDSYVWPENISLICWVECSPLCSISWLKNGRVIPKNASGYSFKEITHPPDPYSNLFESIESTLLDFGHFSGTDLGRIDAYPTYTCRGSSNGVGPPVLSRKSASADYVFLGNYCDLPYDKEWDTKPEMVKCTRKRDRKLIDFWKNERGDIVSNNRVLSLNDVSRDSHNYSCKGYNSWGSAMNETYIDVQPPTELEALVDSEVSLLCHVDANSCGDLLSIKFYKEESMIFVYSHIDGISRAEGDAKTRMNLEYKPGSSSAQLFVKSLELRDEGTYKCMEVRENCKVEQTVKLVILAKPNVVQISQNGTLGNSSLFGPYNVGTNIELKCEAIGGKPIPKVSWYSNNKLLDSTYEAIKRNDGSGTGIAKLQIRLTAAHRKRDFVCIIESDVLDIPFTKTVTADINDIPIAKLVIMEKMPVKAVEKKTVTLVCNMSEDNFEAISKVRWFLDDELLKELPECNYTSFDANGNGDSDGGPLCNIDPHILSLENVTENFAGNYSCMIKNSAGWGSISPSQELIVYYPPSPARLRITPTNVVKGLLVTLSCLVDNPGKPDVLTYVWYRGTELISDAATSPHWTIDPAVFETQDNYTCYASNEGGNGDPSATIFLNVSTPPKFVQALPSYQGILHTAENISLTCRVECSPLCSISWLKDGALILQNASRYSFRETTHPPEPKKNLFESIESTLIFKADHWSSRGLDETSHISTYACQCSSNGVGSHVCDSRTAIGVYYPPENLPMSNVVVGVQEDGKTEIMRCTRKGDPKPTYFWKNERGHIVSNNPTLSLDVVRRNSDTYYCVGYSSYGRATNNTYLNVQSPIEVKGFVGSEVSLPYHVDANSCGELRSIKFYKAALPIFVYNHVDGISRTARNANTRMNLEYKPGSSYAQLVIKSVEVEDEGSYRCLEVRENCNVEQTLKLSTLVKPTFMQMWQNGSIGNYSRLGPYNEGTIIELKCEARAGRPIPKVTFYSNNKIVKSSYEAVEGNNGTGTGIAKLRVRFARSHLKSNLTCVVESDALDEPHAETIDVDVNVKPRVIQVKGRQDYYIEGSLVKLVCRVAGAKPAVKVEWFKENQAIFEATLKTTSKEMCDGTFVTKSVLQFVAAQNHNSMTLTCIASNIVLDEQLSANAFIIVNSRQRIPEVAVSPEILTAKEKTRARLYCDCDSKYVDMSDYEWKKDGENLNLNSPRYRSVSYISRSITLDINDVSREDQGNYTCACANNIGWQESTNHIFLDVQYLPIAEVDSTEKMPVYVVDRKTFTMVCNIKEGNPKIISKVRWYHHSKLLKEVSVCNATSSEGNGGDEGYSRPPCNIDRHSLTLDNVSESDAGYYTCMIQNAAGWGPMSPLWKLTVY